MVNRPSLKEVIWFQHDCCSHVISASIVENLLLMETVLLSLRGEFM